MYQKIIAELKKTNTTLVAVSKTKPIALIQEMYDQGQRIFGENRVQELVEKQAAMPKDIEWHCIGHLQTNKVKQIAPFISMIHSIDSLKLLQEVNKQAKKNDRVIDCLLQFHIAEEATKYGLTLQDCEELIVSPEFEECENVNIVGLMGMATFTDEIDQVKREFYTLKANFDTIKGKYFLDKDDFKEISMGMSGDYKLAIAEGSTMVRIGSLLFGSR